MKSEQKKGDKIYKGYIEGRGRKERERRERSNSRRVVIEKKRRRERITGGGGGRRKRPSGTHVLWSTHQPQWGSPEPRHSPQLRY